MLVPILVFLKRPLEMFVSAIVAWVLFWLMRVVNRMMVADPPKTPPVTKQEQLLTEIRDLLKNR